MDYRYNGRASQTSPMTVVDASASVVWQIEPVQKRTMAFQCLRDESVIRVDFDVEASWLGVHPNLCTYPWHNSGLPSPFKSSLSWPNKNPGLFRSA